MQTSHAGRISVLDPSQYRRTPWKNGAGTTIDIAEQAEVWRFSRTPIVAAGPFSDYAGFERVQVLVAGHGLVLESPDGEIDVRTPFEPVRFAGETPITSRLDAGPVEVVNLIGRRDVVRIDLQVLAPNQILTARPGVHIFYSADGAASVHVGNNRYELESDHGLRIDSGGATTVSCDAGRILLASIE